jgi:hypothetical protein
MIRLFRKLKIKREGKKDAKGQYGKYLLSIGSGKDNFAPSPYMLSFPDRYDKDCNTIERFAFITKHVRNKFNKIYNKKKREFDSIMLQINHDTKALNSAEEILTQNENALKEVNRRIIDAENGMSEGNASDLFRLKATLQAQQSEIKREVDEKKKSIGQLDRKKQSFMHDRTLANLYRQYDAHIGSLCNRMALTKNKYEKEILLYWRALMKKLAKKYPSGNKISLRQMTFDEVAEMKHICIRMKDDIFKDDQSMIRTKAKEFGIQ